MDAIYNDGKSAARHQVRVTFTIRDLHIESADGAIRVRWPADKVGLVDVLEDDSAARFTCTDEPDSRLLIEGRNAVVDLRRRLPGMFRRPEHNPRALFRTILAVVAVGLGVVGFYFAAPSLAAAVAALVPLKWEERFGAQSVEDLAEFLNFSEDQPNFCDNQAGLNALDHVVGRLAETVDTPYRFTVRVINSDMVNAFATTGGHIVIIRGLIEKAEAPEEVVGVLAHEMAHVVERHPTEGVIRQIGWSALGQALFGDSSAIAGIGQVLVTLSYSRADEAEADELGLLMLAEAGLETEGLAQFFDRLSDDMPEGDIPEIFAILSTHPPTEDRAAAARAAGGGTDPGLTPDQWAALQAICPKDESQDAEDEEDPF